MNKINDIRSLVNAFSAFVEDRTGRPGQDVIYPNKLVYYLVMNYKHSIVFADQTGKSKSKDVSLILPLPCVELREIDQVDFPCIPSKGCTFYKSVLQIPKMIGGLPLSVTTADGLITYDHVLWSQFKEKTSSRLEAQNKEPKYTFRNLNMENHIYCYSSNKVEDPKRIALTGYPKDPLEFYQFPTCGEEMLPFCNPLDQEIMIEDELTIRIFEAVLKTLAGAKTIATSGDVLNNDNNDVAVPMKP